MKNPTKKELNQFIQEAQNLFALPISKKYAEISLSEYPFDLQLLSLSPLYRKSRQLFLLNGGSFIPTVCSTMRSLSSPELFKNEIAFTPIASELHWFSNHWQETPEPLEMMRSLQDFSAISLFHEQNHRILWPLLPPAPEEQRDICRYLNFAESIVVTLDLALGDEVGATHSPALERFKTLYRPSGTADWKNFNKKQRRQYLHALLYTTYLALELVEPADIPKAVNYLFPQSKATNKQTVKRGLELSELFTLNTNRNWQARHWKAASNSLAEFHRESLEDVLYLPEDPLDLDEEFNIADRVFDYFGL